MTRIIDMPGDLQPESCGWLFIPVAGNVGILWQPHYRPHSLFIIYARYWYWLS